MRQRAFLLLPLLLLTLVLASGCGRVANPEGWASPVFDNGRTYLFQDKNHLSALNDDGTVRWRFPDDNKEGQKDIDLEAVYGTPTVLGGLIYFATYKGDAFALNTDTGSITWRTKLDGSVIGAPAVSNTYYAVGTTEGRLYVLDVTNGTPVEPWPAKGRKESGPIWAPILMLEDRIVVATMDGKVQAYDVRTGSAAWSTPFKADGAVADLSVLPDGHLYIPSLDKNAYVVSEADGSVVSRVALSHWGWAKPAITPEGEVVVSDISGKALAFDPENGAIAWNYDTAARVKSSPVTIGDVIVLSDREPVVHFVSATTGERLNTVPVEGVGTVRADGVEKDGVAYFLTTKGRLLKADPSNRSVVEVKVGKYSQ